MNPPRRRPRSFLSRIASCFLGSLLLASLVSCDPNPRPSSAPNYLLQKSDGFYTPTGLGAKTGNLLADAAYSPAGPEGASASGSSTPVEPDVYYLDESARRLYAANAYRGLVAFDISDSLHPALIGRCPISGSPKEIYAVNGMIVLLADPSYGPYYYGYAMARAIDQAPPKEAKSCAFFIDPASLALADAPAPTRLELGGSILDSRLVGNSLIVATNEGWIGGSPSASDAIFPSGAAASSTASIGSFQATIRVVDVAGQALGSSYPVAGDCSAIYVASDAVFAALRSSDWSSPSSSIARFDIQGGSLTERGSVGFAGYVSDRFKLDWSEGYLRVIAFDHKNWSDRVTRVFSVDWRDSAAPVSYEKLDGSGCELSAGETLYASRFDGYLAYVVTFFTRDPLHVISFADPIKPIEVGQCQPPGYSTHIEPVTGSAGERLLFAVGVEGGQTKASVFDVSDPSEPREKGSLLLGHGASWSYSPANWDWKRINRLATMNAFALPYYVYDSSKNTGGYSVAIVSYSKGYPELLCELPDSGDVERTIPVAADLVYTYAADRLQAWQLQGTVPEMKAEVTIAENVAWASELGGVGLKILRTGDKLYLKSFASAAYADTLSLSSVELPSTNGANEWLYYSLGSEGIAVIEDPPSVYLLAQSWNYSSSATSVFVYKASLGGGELSLDPVPLVLSGSRAYAPPPGKSGPRFIDAGLSGLAVFHGGLALVDTAAAWPSYVDIPCDLGVAAFAYGDKVDLFSWKEASLEGYGRMSMEEWDLSSGSAVKSAGPSSFPGAPLFRDESGTYVSAYTPSYWMAETVLLAVGAGAAGPSLLGETTMKAGIGDYRAFGGELALIASEGGGYLYAQSAAEARASSGARVSSGKVALRKATLSSSAVIISDVAELSGWGAALVASPAYISPPRLAAASPSEAIVCEAGVGGITVAKTIALPEGGYYGGAGIAFGGDWLYAARGFSGIYRWAR